MEKLKTSKEVKLITLKARKEMAAQGEEYVWKKILEDAQDGYFRTFAYRLSEHTEITISAEFIKELRDKGFRVRPQDRDGWDDLHRFYQGAVVVTWRK